MKAENACLNDCSKRKVIEERSEILPNVGISILSQALIVETINLGDLFGLMVTTENGDSLRIPDFHSDE